MSFPSLFEGPPISKALLGLWALIGRGVGPPRKFIDWGQGVQALGKLIAGIPRLSIAGPMGPHWQKYVVLMEIYKFLLRGPWGHELWKLIQRRPIRHAFLSLWAPMGVGMGSLLKCMDSWQGAHGAVSFASLIEGPP